MVNKTVLLTWKLRYVQQLIIILLHNPSLVQHRYIFSITTTTPLSIWCQSRAVERFSGTEHKKFYY